MSRAWHASRAVTLAACRILSAGGCSTSRAETCLELGVVQAAQDVVPLSVRVVHGVLQPLELGVQAGEALRVKVAGTLRGVPLQLQGVAQGPRVPVSWRQMGCERV